MPTRIIRDGILRSERVNDLSPHAELFYRRLMSVADDHGRYYANPSLLRADCYPLKLDSVKEDSIKKHLAECVSAGLIVLYTVDSKSYLEMKDFGQRINGKSKFPEPSSGIPGESPGTPGDSRLVVGGVVGVDEGGVDAPRKRGKQPKVSMPADFGVSERVKVWAAEKGHARLYERLEHFKGKALANGYTYADWDEAFMGAIRDDWAKLVGPPSSSRPQTQSPKQAMAPTETKLERAVNWARQQHHNGQIDAAERDRLIAEATAKHRSNG